MKLVLVMMTVLIPFTSAFAEEPLEEPLVMEEVIPSGQVKIQIIWPEVLPDKLETVLIKFLDPETNELLEDVSINYSIAIVQNDSLIEFYDHFMTDEGWSGFGVVFPLHGVGPAEIMIEINSIADGSNVVEINEEVTFNVEVVPEFGTIALIVMTFSFVAVLAVQRLRNVAIQN